VAATNFAGPNITLDAAFMSSIEYLDLTSTSTFSFTTADDFVGPGKTFELRLQFLPASGHISFDGSAETDARLVLRGSDHAETFIGGDGGNFLVGGQGGDDLTGGSGQDTFAYANSLDSWGRDNHDTVTGFDTHHDLFRFDNLLFGVAAIDPEVDGGTLTTANFEVDLTLALQDDLKSNHAIIFKPDQGSYAGTTLLVVDMNFEDGYQNQSDAVIVLNNPRHLADLDVSDL
jgi:Ca2+-binding RTX toxin-like protein